VVVRSAVVGARRDGTGHEGGGPEGIGDLHDGLKCKSSRSVNNAIVWCGLELNPYSGADFDDLQK
jgi:hypothetical protein